MNLCAFIISKFKDTQLLVLLLELWSAFSLLDRARLSPSGTPLLLQSDHADESLYWGKLLKLLREV